MKKRKHAVGDTHLVPSSFFGSEFLVFGGVVLPDELTEVRFVENV